MAKCSFCGNDIPLGTGKMFVLKDGRIQFFDSKKCEKNLVKLGRKPRTTQWTQAYHTLKKQGKAGKEKGEPAA